MSCCAGADTSACSGPQVCAAGLRKFGPHGDLLQSGPIQAEDDPQTSSQLCFSEKRKRREPFQLISLILRADVYLK